MRDRADAPETELTEALARALSIYPVEFRKRHLSKPGDPMSNNQPWASMGAHEVLKAAAEHPTWKDREAWKKAAPEGTKRGVGIALGPRAL